MQISKSLQMLSLTVLAVTAGCSSGAQIKIEESFPTVLYESKNINTTVVFDEAFRIYSANPVENVTIDMGQAQVDLLTKAFQGLFNEVTVVSSKDEVKATSELVIIPSVREVQLSTPSDSYLNVYEIWIKYNLDIETFDGEAIDSWFMPAYGKTPNSFTVSKSKAIEQASIVALRDAGAKLILDFYRIPSIHGWMVQNKKLEVKE
jgi:hypothetical protein